MPFEEGLIGKAILGKTGTGLHARVNNVAGKVHERIARIFSKSNKPEKFRNFSSYEPINGSRPKENGFHPGFSFAPNKVDTPFSRGIPGTEEKPQASKSKNPMSGNTSFNQGIHTAKEPQSANKNLDISTLSVTKFRTVKVERLTLSNAQIFDETGKYKETLIKGTTILADTDKPILCKIDVNTGRKQAYMAITGYIHKDSQNHESITSGTGLIRASWLDSRIQERKIEEEVKPKQTGSYKTEKEVHKPSSPSYNNVFQGAVGKDGIPISPYILKAVAMNYLGKEVVPKIDLKIDESKRKISMVREIMQKEYITKKIPLKETTGYKVQLKQLEEKTKMETLKYSIKNFSMNGNTVITDPNIEQLLLSLRKTPKWKEFVWKAAEVEKKKRQAEKR